jgi:amino acid transporter
VTLVIAFAFLAVYLIVCLGYVVVASLLIHGARTAKPGLMMPWIILTAIGFVLDLISMIRYIVMGYFAGLGGGLLFLALAIYLFIVVWSHRVELQGNPSGDSAGKA